MRQWTKKKFSQSLGSPTKAPTTNDNLHISLESPLYARGQSTEKRKKVALGFIKEVMFELGLER